ncbi:MAG TPA: MauE/DoxX family redox-associated membrane protein [Flavobacterium sp.]|nr:MauE/DoxX family redox-associated membrane protein [Flavobacterium sp.]
MKHTYSVTGMTCNGCRAGVESKLSAVEGVKAVSVNLEKGEAEIEMENHIPLEVFEKALPEKYAISEKTKMPVEEMAIKEKTEWQQLFPLFLILGYIAIAAVLLNRNPWNADGFMLDFMGIFFIVFSFFKMLDLKGFPDSFRMYDPLAKKVSVYAVIYPFVETALGLMFLLRFEIGMALVATIIILGITTIGVTKVLLDKKSIQCACLGTALKLPMTKATFIENSIMIVMAILMLYALYSR